LFETGAIVFHIAQRHAGLLPDDADARARAITWMFRRAQHGGAADPWNSEPPGSLRATSPGPRNACLSSRIASVTGWANFPRRLGDADWLDGAFSAGDLMMVSVLLRLKASGLLDEYPNLSAYVARGEARAAYKRAFDAQLAVNTGKQPTG